MRLCHRRPSSEPPCMQASQQALALMEEWRDVSVGDALQMLAAAFRTNAAVRSFAVKVLRTTASDDKLLEFMIQLVQCVRFDGDDGRGPLAGVPPLSLHAVSSTASVEAARLSPSAQSCGNAVATSV